MHENSPYQPKQPEVIVAEQLPEGGLELGADEEVIIQSDHSRSGTFLIRNAMSNESVAVDYVPIVIVCAGDYDSGVEDKIDKFEIMYFREGGTYAIRAVNHVEEGTIPTFSAMLGDIWKIGKSGLPPRNHVTHEVGSRHFQVNVENQLRIKNLNPRYKTILFNVQSA